MEFLFYNAVINFSGKRQEVASEKLSNEYIFKITMEAQDYDEESGQPNGGNIMLYLLNGKGEPIEAFIPANAEATVDGGIAISLGNSQ